MNTTFKTLLAASATILVATPAFAANYNLIASPTGNGDYTFDITDSAPSAGTHTDTFSFTIPGVLSGSAVAGAFNVAVANSTSNIDFISALLTGPGTSVPLTVSNTGPVSSFFNDPAIPVVAGAAYVLSVTYSAGGSGASFGGNVSFSPAPEPATWGMMMLGFGLVGMGLRARRGRRTVRVACA